MKYAFSFKKKKKLAQVRSFSPIEKVCYFELRWHLTATSLVEAHKGGWDLKWYNSLVNDEFKILNKR